MSRLRCTPRATDCTSATRVTPDPPITQGTACDEPRTPVIETRVIENQISDQISETESRGIEKRNRTSKVIEAQQTTGGSRDATSSAAADIARAVQEALALQAVIHQAQICKLHIMFQDLQITRDRYSESQGTYQERPTLIAGSVSACFMPEFTKPVFC